MNQDEFGGVAVVAPTADEFGGEPVMAAADEFGGVPIQAEATAPVPEAVGTVRGLAASVQRGFMRMQGLPDVLAATTMRDAAKPTVRQERRAYVAAMNDPRYLMAAMEDPARAEAMFGPAAKLDQITSPARFMQQFTAEDVAANKAAIAAVPQSEAQREMGQAASTSDKWAAWRKNPIELTASIALESLPPSIVGAVAGTAVGGPGVGTAFGAGASSGLLTFSSELLGEAGKAGYDVKDAAQLQAFLNDALAFDRAVNTAVTKAGIVGPVDASTAGVAGRFLGPALKQGLRQTLFASGKERGMQMAGGAGGEGLAQIASGQPLDTFDIIMEGIAELGSAPVEIASNLRAAAKPSTFVPRPSTFFSEFGGEANATEVVTAPGPSSADVTKTPTSEGANAGARPDLQTMPAEQTTVPELPATLHGQVVKMRAGKAPAVLFTPADTIPEWALQDERFEVVETPEGRIMFDTAAWTKDQITQLVSAGQMGTVLGYGVADRPAQATAVVTVRDKAGLELRAVGVTEATLPTVMEAAQRYADEGDVVAVESPANVIAKRLAGAGAGTTVRTADAEAQSAAYLEGKRYREEQARKAVEGRASKVESQPGAEQQSRPTVEIAERHLEEARQAVADLRGEERVPDILDDLEGVTSGPIRVPAELADVIDASRERLAQELHGKPFKRLSSAQRKAINKNLRVSTTEGFAANEAIPGLGEKWADFTVDDLTNAVLDASEARLLERKKGDSKEVLAMAEEIARAEQMATEIVDDWDQAAAISQAEAGLIRGSAAEKWADTVIADAQKRMNTGLDPELLAAYAVKGAAMIEQGVVDFAAWSSEMVKKYGAKIQPHLEDVWRETRFQVARNFNSRNLADRKGLMQESRGVARGNANGGGYVGYSMSVRANNAYADGKLPASKGAKEIGISTELFRQIFQPSEWHHTSKHFNATDFFDMPAIWERIATEPDISLRIRNEMKTPAKKQEWWHRAVEARLNAMYERIGEDHVTSWVNRPNQFANRNQGRSARLIELGNTHAKNEFNLQSDVEKRLEGKPLTEANYLAAIEFVKAARADGFSVAELPSGNLERDTHELNRHRAKLAEGEAFFARGIRQGSGKPFTTDNQRQNALDSMAKRRRLISIYENANATVAGGAAGIKTQLESRAESGAAGETLRLDSRLNDVNQSNILPESQRDKAVVGNTTRMVSAGATTPEASHSVKLESALDSLKLDTKGQMHAFGLLPEAWNTLIDIAKLALKSSRTLGEAIDYAIAEFKRLFPDQTITDEAGARAQLMVEVPTRATGKRITASAAYSEGLKARLTKLIYERRPQDTDMATAAQMVDSIGEANAIDLVTAKPDWIPGALRVALGTETIRRLNAAEVKARQKNNVVELDEVQSQGARLADVLMEQATDPAQTIAAYNLLAKLSPDVQVARARRDVEQAGEKEIDRHEGKTDAMRKALEEGRAAGIEAVKQDMETNRAAREAVNETVKNSDETHRAIVMELAEPWAQSEYILNHAREAVRAKANELLNTQPRPPQFTPAQHLRVILNDLAKRAAGIFAGHIQGAEPGVALVEKLKQRLGIDQAQAVKLASSLSKEWDKQLDAARKNLDTRLANARARQERREREAESNAAVDRALRRQLRELNLKLGDAIRQASSTRSTTGDTIADRTVAASGLTGPKADALRARLQARWNDLVSEAQRNALAAIEARSTVKVDRKLREAFERLIELDRLAPVDGDAFFKAVRSALKLPEITEAQAKEIRSLTLDAQQKPEGWQQQQAVARLETYVHNAAGKYKWHDGPMAFWFSNLLAAPLSWAANGVGNTMLQALQLATEIALKPKHTDLILRAYADGVGKGYANSWHTLRTGETLGLRLDKAREARWLEAKRLPGNWDYLLTKFRLPGRVLSAQDISGFARMAEVKWNLLALEKAKETGKRGAQLAQEVQNLLFNTEADWQTARAQAATEGLTGNAAYRRAHEIIEQRRENVLPGSSARARQYGLDNTYNGEYEGWLGNLGQAIENANRNLVVTKFFAPIVRFPIKATQIGLEFSPAGWGYVAKGEWTGKVRKNVIDQERLSELYARATIGTLAAVGMGLYLASNADDPDPEWWLYGAGPSDPDKRNALMAETGWIPRSFKTPWGYWSWAESTAAPLFAVMGNYFDAVRFGKLDEQDAAARMAYVVQSIPDLLINKSVTKGVQEVFDVMNSDRKIKKTMETLGRKASGFVVGNDIKMIDRLFDPQVYKPDDIQSALLANFPVARAQGRPVLTVFGTPLETSPEQRFYSGLKPDPLTATLFQKRAWPSMPDPEKAFVGNRNLGEDYIRPMTADEYYNWVAISGPEIRRRLTDNLDRIQGMTSEDAQTFVENIVAEERAKAKPKN